MGSAAYDDVDLLDMEFEQDEETYFFPCPCGDRFFITVEDLLDYEEMAECPSCSLVLHVIYDPSAFMDSIEAADLVLENEEAEEERVKSDIDKGNVSDDSEEIEKGARRSLELQEQQEEEGQQQQQQANGSPPAETGDETVDHSSTCKTDESSGSDKNNKNNVLTVSLAELQLRGTKVAAEEQPTTSTSASS